MLGAVTFQFRSKNKSSARIILFSLPGLKSAPWKWYFSAGFNISQPEWVFWSHIVWLFSFGEHNSGDMDHVKWNEALIREHIRWRHRTLCYSCYVQEDISNCVSSRWHRCGNACRFTHQYVVCQKKISRSPMNNQPKTEKECSLILTVRCLQT